MVRSVAFAPDGATLASASWDQTIKLWTRDDLSGDLIPTTLPFRTEEQTHTDWIWSVNFLPGEGGVMASAGSDEKVILWSLPRE